MHNKAEEPVRKKMESLRFICDTQIPISQQKVDSFAASFRHSLESVKAKAQDTIQNQAKLAKLKADLRDAEDEFVKVLAVKTRTEAKQMATRDSIAAKKARVEELKRSVEIQRARRDEYSAIISRQSMDLATCEEKKRQDIGRKGEIQEAILWYNRVLSLHVEGGHGVKFTFNNINMENPKEEYTFTICHANDTYTLLDCDPPLNNIKELIQELNRTNGLFKFVRIMREKFQEAAGLGLTPQASPLRQDASTISLSAPSFSVSSDRSESPGKRDQCQMQHGEVSRLVNKVIHRIGSPSKENEHQIQHGGSDRQSKKVNHGRRAKQALLSPESASSLRRSSRSKVT
ncbi:hypothetical protein JRO89_XS13G0203600 [Xanthoceras sorbifolium]|uniref:Kinetochore protein SPC25 n=1 Tax=Xanthoceras sorbifolium TaxID=99658 RepID=A0ABQ8H988_9ROSI|nr:hypothetical protein JRO89_XS13G0203600 [Xanthoceras sorbifolium]